MPGKRSSFTLPVEPISPPPKPASRIGECETGFGGGAGYRPRVRRAYFDAVYRHSRARRHLEYSTPARFSKAGPGETRDAPVHKGHGVWCEAGFSWPASLGREPPGTVSFGGRAGG